MGGFILYLYSHKRIEHKFIEDYYRDMFSFMFQFPFLHPWRFLMSMFGSAQETMARKHEPYHELAYFFRETFINMRIIRAVKYLLLMIGCTAMPLMGSVFWLFGQRPMKMTILKTHTTTKVDKEEQEENGTHERWFYVNGNFTDFELAKLNAKHLAGLFHRNIELVYNPSYGPIYDIAQCIGGRTFEILGPVETILKHSLMEALADSSIRKVVLIGHSKGTIVTCNAVRHLIERGTPELRRNIESKLEVYNFAAVSDIYAVMQNGPVYEVFVNPMDALVNIRSDTMKVVRSDSPAVLAEVNAVLTEPIMPKILTNKDSFKCGHFLSAHYLPDFYAGQYVPSTEKKESAKLLSYTRRQGKLL